MYPPKVSNAEVRAVIRNLSTGAAPPSGAAVREALRARYGSRCGVSRIYRLLADERRRLAPPAVQGDVQSLREQLQAMQGRAERAEERELAHQERWALEIDQLRQKLLSLESLVHQARIDRENNERLRQRLQASEQRVAVLEQQLIAAHSRSN